jgi:hypothetical protein
MRPSLSSFQEIALDLDEQRNAHIIRMVRDRSMMIPDTGQSLAGCVWITIV